MFSILCTEICREMWNLIFLLRMSAFSTTHIVHFFIVPTQAITISISLPFLYPCKTTIKVGASAYWHRNICTYTIAWSDISISYICPQCDVQIMKVVLTLLPDSIIMIAKQANFVQKFILTCSDGRAKFDILNNHAHAEWLRPAHVSQGTGTRIEEALISRAARCGLFFNLEINHWILLI